MKITIGKTAYPGRKIQENVTINISTGRNSNSQLDFKTAIVYPTLINSHDHMIGNWYPKAGTHRPYINSHIWVEDMKQTESVLERNKIWVNDGSFDLMKGEAPLLALIGAYKNIFSGCTVVQDHGPNQTIKYYDLFPINILRNYRQCHSLTLGNWWGGLTPNEEWKLTKLKEPFIIHLGEGFDEVTRNEFSKLMEMGLLQPNTIIVHGVSLTKQEIRQCADAGSTLCWCPSSNFYLLDKTLDIETCLEYGLNVILGTDSSLSGSINLFDEIHTAHQKFPHISMMKIFEMVTVNAEKALFLPESERSSHIHSESILIMDSLDDDPYLNLTKVKSMNIKLMLYKGKPIYGDAELLDSFSIDQAQYSNFTVDERHKFVIGDPMKLNNQIDAKLGYHKHLPYFPF